MRSNGASSITTDSSLHFYYYDYQARTTSVLPVTHHSDTSASSELQIVVVTLLHTNIKPHKCEIIYQELEIGKQNFLFIITLLQHEVLGLFVSLKR